MLWFKHITKIYFKENSKNFKENSKEISKSNKEKEKIIIKYEYNVFLLVE